MVTAPIIDNPIAKTSFFLNFSCSISGAMKQFAIKATVPSGATTEAGAKAYLQGVSGV